MKACTSRILDRTNHPDRIFLKDNIERNNGHEAFCLYVLYAVYIIDYLLFNRIIVQCVERKIAAHNVFVHSTEAVAYRAVRKRTECAYFKYFVAEKDVNEAETLSDYSRIVKQFFYSCRSCISCNIKIFGCFSYYKVSYRTTYNICIITVIPETGYYLESVRIYLFFFYWMFVFSVYNGLFYRSAVFVC